MEIVSFETPRYGEDPEDDSLLSEAMLPKSIFCSDGMILNLLCPILQLELPTASDCCALEMWLRN